jgi:hypothetical protein
LSEKAKSDIEEKIKEIKAKLNALISEQKAAKTERFLQKQALSGPKQAEESKKGLSFSLSAPRL